MEMNGKAQAPEIMETNGKRKRLKSWTTPVTSLGE
jgi:hypothetical protein